MTSSDLEYKIETAFRKLIETDAGIVALAVRVFEGMNDEQLVFPRIVCDSALRNESPEGSGCHMVDVELRIISHLHGASNAGEQKDIHRSYVRAVRNVVTVSNLEALVSALVSDLTIMNVWSGDQTPKQIDGDAVITTVNLLVYAADSAMS